MTVVGTFEAFPYGKCYFGLTQDSVTLSGTITNALLERALTQTVENDQQIAHTVTIGGVDLSEYVGSIFIKCEEKRIAASCNIVLIGSQPASVVDGAAVVITSTFTFEDATIFTNTIFSGSIRQIQPSTGSRQQSVNVLAYDDAEAGLSGAPVNSTWTGTNTALVQHELMSAGFFSLDLDFAEFTMTAASLAGFSTVRDLILAAAGAIDEVVAFFLPSGMLCVRSITSLRESGLTIPTSGYTYLQETSNANDRYSTVTVQGSTGATGTATGTGKYPYEFTSAFPLTAANCATKAAAIAAKAELSKRTTQIPSNPLLGLGSVFGIIDGTTTRTCRITGISTTVQWTGPKSSPGAWDAVTIEDAD